MTHNASTRAKHRLCYLHHVETTDVLPIPGAVDSIAVLNGLDLSLTGDSYLTVLSCCEKTLYSNQGTGRLLPPGSLALKIVVRDVEVGGISQDLLPKPTSLHQLKKSSRPPNMC
ncbi:uncharacterized protein RCC_09228 [Ramularia collo-cygni]|uniref:Uncharacterized protein n=1 Tax=Ramularia collo-cygni TaxID=112498 RepID=A0A2D3VLP8_9PEZI|nr:uncharacterized protein RCC_09228 [Ramularia collo-cygni]CZT23514.1 uncharacterized protein RCC_09228 [Ramularia collo-cygni]